MTNPATWDLVIIGGGVNGAGIARDAAGRGLSVLLCEQDDLASGTSSASSKLIHGGLRYLEYFEFRLVREALAEREVLLGNASHLIRPLPFVLPHDHTLRPAWMIRLGLFLYDHLSGRRRLRGSYRIDLRRHPFGEPLQSRLYKGFVYSDCWVDDSRLVVLNAMDAARRGAAIHTRTRCTRARREGGLWNVTLEERGSGEVRTVQARMLVNAAGPWIGLVMEQALERPHYSHLSLVKGSHIVVPRLYAGEQAYILQHTDRRVIFVIPFLERFSLIGTTDEPFVGDPADAHIEPKETRYLCDAVNRYLAAPVRPEDVLWDFAGVRPLYNDLSGDPSATSREYVLEMDAPPGEPALLSLIGGKITAYRQVAEHALTLIAPHFSGLGGPWTARAPLPGGDFPGGDFSAWLAELEARHPWLPAGQALRMARAYGTLTEELLEGVRDAGGMGRQFGHGLSEREVAWMREREWARTAADILWRRSKLGLLLSPQEQAELREWLGEAGPSAAAN